MMFGSHDPETADRARRQRKKLHRIPLLGRFVPAEEKRANAAFAEKQRFVKAYIDSELAPHLVGCEPFTSPTILHGFFKGLKFGDPENLQAGIAQKIFGVYEVELTDQLETLSGTEYDFIINIGAAEGLYSLAFERMWPDAPIYSFEQDYETRELLRQLCEMNRGRNVAVNDEFRLSSIKDINAAERGLVFCDCEGFEDEIFAPDNMGQFRSCDLVIETHDQHLPGVTERLMANLAGSHRPRIIDQIGLEQRAERIKDPIFCANDLQTRLQMLDESRHPKNQWVFAETGAT